MFGWIKRNLCCLLVTAVACGCAQERATYLPDGRQGYAITCGRLTQSWGKCLEKAGRLCGRGGYVINYENELEHELLVGCRAPHRSELPQE